MNFREFSFSFVKITRANITRFCFYREKWKGWIIFTFFYSSEQKSWKGSVLNSVSTLDEISHGCCHASNHSDIIFFSLCERSWRIEAEINTTLEINCIRSLLMFLANFIVDIGEESYIPMQKIAIPKKIFKICNAYIVNILLSKEKKK